MQLHIRLPGTDITAELRQEVHDRLKAMLDRYAMAIHTISLFVDEQHGPYEDTPREGRLVVQLKGLGMIVIEGQAHDEISLVDRLAHRATFAINRRIARRSDRRYRAA